MFANCELHSLGWFACQALRKHKHLLEAMGQPLWPAAGYHRATAGGVSSAPQQRVSTPTPTCTPGLAMTEGCFEALGLPVAGLSRTITHARLCYLSSMGR